jgi:1-acyl-sn-glycerol-3-phosphate acyltransferase
VFGKKHIPKVGGFILASNHVSYLDPIALGVSSPRKLNYMARHDLFFNHWFSWLLSSVGSFPVKRDSADTSAIKEAMRRLTNGEPLVLFPEGSRRFNGKSSEPQPGIGFLASKLNIPVIPAFIKGRCAFIVYKTGKLDFWRAAS